MVQVRIEYGVLVTNTGVQHDVCIGCSLLDPSTGTELYPLAWWVVWNVASGEQIGLAVWVTGNIPAGTYLAKARAWENYSGGTKVNNIIDEYGDIVGAIYQAGVGILTGILDEATQTLVVSEGVVSARIDDFAITV